MEKVLVIHSASSRLNLPRSQSAGCQEVNDKCWRRSKKPHRSQLMNAPRPRASICKPRPIYGFQSVHPVGAAHLETVKKPELGPLVLADSVPLPYLVAVAATLELGGVTALLELDGATALLELDGAAAFTGASVDDGIAVTVTVD